MKRKRSDSSVSYNPIKKRKYTLSKKTDVLQLLQVLLYSKTPEKDLVFENLKRQIKVETKKLPNVINLPSYVQRVKYTLKILHNEFKKGVQFNVCKDMHCMCNNLDGSCDSIDEIGYDFEPIRKYFEEVLEHVREKTSVEVIETLLNVVKSHYLRFQIPEYSTQSKDYASDLFENDDLFNEKIENIFTQIGEIIVDANRRNMLKENKKIKLYDLIDDIRASYMDDPKQLDIFDDILGEAFRSCTVE